MGTNTSVEAVGDGAVQLSGVLREDFGQGTLASSRWRWGSWSGAGYTASPSGGTLVVDAVGGAYVRSQQGFTGATVDTSLFFVAPGAGEFTLGTGGGMLFLNFTPIPEPGLMLLVAAGVAAAGVARRRRTAGRGPVTP